MGGRGGSGGGGSGRGRGLMREVVSYTGDTIDLSEFPLSYDNPDPAVNGDVRSKVKEFEDKRYKQKIEYGTVIGSDAVSLGEARGGRGSVKIPTSWLNSGQVFSHNHPRAGAQLGGTFSIDDLRGFSRTGISTYRATAAEGTYSITKGRNFDSAKALAYFEKVESECRGRYAAALKSVDAAYRRGELTRQQYAESYDREFNRYLVDSHNQLKAGRKTYGYDYRLEKR